MSENSVVAKRPYDLTVRAPEIEFDDSIPVNWHLGNYISSMLLDGLGITIPVGERFFIRTLKRARESMRLTPEHSAAIDAFIGQESAHTDLHERYLERLEHRGIAAHRLLRNREKVYAFIERWTSLKFCLAITAAIEHFTAVNGAFTLGYGLMKESHPAMRRLWDWHSAEEIEHKAIAYDVLKDLSPWNYPLRALGFLVSVMLEISSFANARREYRKVWNPTRREYREEYRALHRKLPPSYNFKITLAMLRYLKPGFHPDQVDDYHLAKRYFANWSPTLDAPSAPDVRPAASPDLPS